MSNVTPRYLRDPTCITGTSTAVHVVPRWMVSVSKVYSARCTLPKLTWNARSLVVAIFIPNMALNPLTISAIRCRAGPVAVTDVISSTKAFASVV